MNALTDIEKVMLAVFGGAITLAIVSVLVSPSAQTGNILTAFGNVVSKIIGAATSPVTGSGSSSGGPSFGSSLSNGASTLNQIDSALSNLSNGVSF